MLLLVFIIVACNNTETKKPREDLERFADSLIDKTHESHYYTDTSKRVDTVIQKSRDQ